MEDGTKEPAFGKGGQYRLFFKYGTVLERRVTSLFLASVRKGETLRKRERERETQMENWRRERRENAKER